MTLHKRGTLPETDHISSHHIKNEALDWFLRLQDDDTAETIHAFESWLKDDPAHQKAYSQLEALYRMPALRKATLSDTRMRNTHVQGAPVKRRNHKRQKMFAFVAASCAMLLIFTLQFNNLWVWWQADFQTAYGEQQIVNLPDGSVVLLNSGTAIALDFTDQERRINLLKGEAFFDVEHNKKRPFSVHGQYLNVRVTGTAFSVSTDKQKDYVVLEQGSVDVWASHNQKTLTQLTSGEAIAASGDTLSPISKANLTLDLAWKNGRIIFHDRPFSEALDNLKRYYSGTVLMVADSEKLPLVSGNYRIDEPEAAIRTLATASGIKVTYLPGNIFILY
ncbi:FecR family protein [Brucellaceae bacterium C25G]